MEKDSCEVYDQWAVELRQRGLSDAARVLLDAFKPLRYLASQALYTGQPLLKNIISRENWGAVMQLVENRSDYAFFYNLLAGEGRDEH